MGEASSNVHLSVKSEWGVSVTPDLLVADVGSDAKFSCDIFSRDSNKGKDIKDMVNFEGNANPLKCDCPNFNHKKLAQN